MDLQPSDFVLTQERHGQVLTYLHLNVDTFFVVSCHDQERQPVMCQVTSEHQFSAAIREDIKFAVSLRNSKGKERVPTRQDLCSLSHDGKRFSFGFDTNQLGAYKVRIPY